MAQPSLKFPVRARVGLAAGLVVLVAAFVAWRHYAVRESTDDAQVDGHIYSIAARVGGSVQSVDVAENQRVEAGALLVQIDPRDYRVAVARAQAELDEAQAGADAARTGVPVAATSTASQLQGAESELAMAQARWSSSQARQRAAEATEQKALQDLERQDRLLAKDEVSQQEHDAAVLAATSARAERESLQAAAREAEQGIATARAREAQARTGPQQLTIVRAQAASAEAHVQQLRAALQQAQIDLEHASVRAPVSGVVSKKAVEVGQVVQAGQPLMAVVPLEDVWVMANFKESQLRDLRPGQPATISVDAFGGRSYRGHVDSVAPATGARFSLLPAENASGNFVKVVQRVPVKIVFEPGQDAEHLLRPGLSVVPTVLTR